MSSTTITQHGLARNCTESAKDFPEAYTVIGVDITEEDIRKRYAGNDLALAYIDAVLQINRNTDGPSPAFIRTLYAGVIDPVSYIALGPDRYKKSHNVMLSGNMRILGMRPANKARERNGDAPLKVIGFPFTFSGKDEKEKAGKARDVKSYANVRNPMRLSHKAELAAQYDREGMSDEDIALRCEVLTTRDVKELRDYAGALPRLSPESRAAIDSGKVRLGRAVAALAKLDHAGQSASLAPKERKARSGKGAAKAAPKPKAPAASVLPWAPKMTAPLADELGGADFVAASDIIRLLGGDFSRVDEMDPALVAILERYDIPTIAPEEAEEEAE